MPEPYKLTQQDKIQIMHLHMVGWPPKRLAKEFNVTYHAILYYTRALEPFPKSQVLELTGEVA